jgi:uncharacterized protein
MKSILVSIVAAVVLVGSGESQSPEQPTAKAPNISILNAAAKGNIDAIKQHLAAGTDANSKDKYGSSPLFSTATKEIVELLIAKGADVNAKLEVRVHPHEKGETPLDWAIRFRKTETAALLRKHGGKTGEELKAEGIDNTDHQNKTE